MYGVKNYADRRDLHNSRHCLLDIRLSCHLKCFMLTMKALKDGGILKYIERRTDRMRKRILNLFHRTTCSTESGFFSVHCTPRLSTFRTWLLFRNSPYKCQLVYARGEVSFDYAVWMYNLSGTCRLIFYVMHVLENGYFRSDWKLVFSAWYWSSDQRITSSV